MDLKCLEAIWIASWPEIRITAIAHAPAGVAKAIIDSFENIMKF